MFVHCNLMQIEAKKYKESFKHIWIYMLQLQLHWYKMKQFFPSDFETSPQYDIDKEYCMVPSPISEYLNCDIVNWIFLL
jgi:hypothetical protein